MSFYSKRADKLSAKLRNCDKSVKGKNKFLHKPVKKEANP